jgi:hypothetical protein
MRRLLLVVTAVVIASACGGGRPQAASKPTATEAVLKAKMVTTGALHLSSAFTSTTGPNGARTCADAASKGNSAARQFLIAAPGSRTAPLYFTVSTVGYHGPASYGPTAVRLDSVLAEIGGKSTYFRPADKSVASMTIEADGSGTARFSSFEGPNRLILSAEVTWRCDTEVA